MKLKPSEPVGLSQRLTVRMTFEDWTKLRELQVSMGMPSPGRTLRSLVRLHWAAEQAALKRMKRDPNTRARIQAMLSGGPGAYFEAIEAEAHRAAKRGRAKS